MTGTRKPTETAPPPERAIVVHVVTGPSSQTLRPPEACLDEAVGLAQAIHLDIAYAETITVKRPAPGKFFGRGQVSKVKTMVDGHDADLVIVNHTLSPVQQRNLEKAWKAKVIDRTGLILEIFGERARTKEGQLQVELAALSYQRSRLVRSWTHLERQRGGFGFTGGPGETQIEIDRRLIAERITKLKKELDHVRQTRKLARKSRERVPYPVVALVGYTNAGKSTLFNALTGEKVLAKDLLFATLDPTMREVELPSEQKVILSDTVGFISDLPTDLIAAFRATLEEVQEADVILHVRDVSTEYSDAERHDVEAILRDLDIDPDTDPRLIEVLNKVDLLSEEDKEQTLGRAERNDNQIALSALTGEGADALRDAIDALVTANRKTYDIDLDATDGKALAWLYRHGHIVAREDSDEKIHIKIDMDPIEFERFNAEFLI